MSGKRPKWYTLRSNVVSQNNAPKLVVKNNVHRCNKKRNENEKKADESFFNVEQLILNSEYDQRPYAKVDILGITITGLLDSGSSITLLGTGGVELVDKLGLTIFDKAVKVSTADGANHTVLGYVDIPFYYNEKLQVLPTLMVPSIKQKLILGMDFWKAFDIRPEIHEINEVVGEETVSQSEDEEPEHTLTETQRNQLNEAIKKFKVADDVTLGYTHLLEHTINTANATPVYVRPYVYSPCMEGKIQAEIERMYRAGTIAPSTSPWNNPLVAVPKSNGSTRVCLDARKLNSVTVRDDFPIPNLNRILSRLKHTKYLTSIDLKEAYHQVRLDESSSDKTSFSFNSSKWKYLRLPFGLHNSAQCLARLMDKVIPSSLEPQVFKYLDDLIISSSDFESHCKMIEEVARLLKAANLSINLEKSKFCRKKLNYLGYTVGQDGVEVTAHKVKAVLNLAPPNNIKEVRRVIGMANWYKRFIPDYSNLMSPITDLLKGKKKKIEWTSAANQAFINLKTALVQAPVLATVRYDLDFKLYCDASDVACGATLTQNFEEGERPVAYFSTKLSACQQKYSTTERECLAVLLSIENFRYMIEGATFTVVTDHIALKWLLGLKPTIFGSTMQVDHAASATRFYH
jgi:hypothetical protein